MKSLKFKNKTFILLMITLALFTACSEEEDLINTIASGYVVGFRASDGESSADYLLTHNDLMTGTISATGQGFEQAGWSYYFAAGGKYFSIGYTLNEVIAYEISAGALAYDDKFIFDRIDLIAPVDNESFLGIGAPWGGGSYNCNIQIIDIEDVLISKNIEHPIYESFDSEGVQLNAWPTGAYIQDNKLFISSYTLYGDTWGTPNTDSAIVSVFSYPELEYQSSFTDGRTGPIGYYSSQPVILETENGDHYTISPTSLMAGYTQTTKPSGILRIKNGEEQFDEGYFFNIEDEGYKVMNGVYVGNNKAVVKVVSQVTEDTLTASWGAFGNYAIMETAVIDLESKSFTLVNNVPVHRGQYLTPFLIEDGLVYMVAGNAASEYYIYRINPETATGEKGAKIDGIDVQCIYKI